MWNVIWLWKFPDHGKKSHENRVNTELPKNVIQIPTQLNREDTFDKELAEFQIQVNLIIENIISDWVIDYLDTIKQSNKNIKKYYKDMNWISDEMKIKAKTIDDTIEYLENKIDSYFDWEFVIIAIADILSVYRDEVFELLMKKHVNKGIGDDISNEIFVDETDELQKQFEWVIETIINNWISDYLASISQLNTPLARKKFTEDTNGIFEKMLKEAKIIDDTIVYIEDELNMWFYNDFVIGVVTEMMMDYRIEVFDLLVEKYANV